jgi:uncharacterized protein (TIGR02594 family)
MLNLKTVAAAALAISILATSVEASIVADASRFIGMNERKHTNSLQKITKVNPRKTPWCAAFVNGILKRNGKKTTNSAAAASFKTYGKRVTKPIKGDIVVMRGHVGIFMGFVTKNGKRYVAVLGGNQSNSVKVSYYPVSRVVAYRRPV